MSPALKAALLEAINDPALDGAEFSFHAQRLKDGAMVAQFAPDALINPASNAKLITTAAALDVLKAEYRFRTEYYVQGTLKDGTLYGNLVVKGYGDPTIVTERLAHIVNELYLYGVERITGSIVVDNSWFDNVTEARGWETEESPDRAYAAAVTALSVNYNATAIYVRPGSTIGAPAIVRVDPACEQVVLEGEVMTEAVGAGVRVVSDEGKDGAGRDNTLLTVEGSIGAREPPFRVYRRVYEPHKHFGSVLVALMQQRGIKVRHSIVEGTVKEGAKLILVDRSDALADVLRNLNHYSNNIIAETIIKTMGAEVMGAPGTFDNGLLVARKFLQEKVGFVPGSYTFNNGSGLNDVNRFTAHQLVRLLAYMNRDFEGGVELASSLAVAGTQGTIHFRMRDTPAQRRLRAKTGTLRGVSALSGYVVTPAGEVVAFSMLAQGFKNGASSVWKVQNAVGTAFASDGTWHPKDDAAESQGEAISSTDEPWRAVAGTSSTVSNAPTWNAPSSSAPSSAAMGGAP